MSVKFNDTSTYRGLVQLYEKEIGANRGYVSGNTDLLKEFAAGVNQAWDDYLALALPASGIWQFDDSNHSDYPIIKTNLVDGQRDYNFTTDEAGNLILDIYKVAILPSATATLYEEVSPVDAQSDEDAYDLVAENTTEGTPIRYDKTANGIFFDPIPSYNATLGLKIYINREPSYFTYQDLTKKPGCPGIHHKYFYLKPALDYARRKGLSNYKAILKEVQDMEGVPSQGLVGSIESYFAQRGRDEEYSLINKPISYR